MQKKIASRKKQIASLFILLVFFSVFAVNSLAPSGVLAQGAPIFAFYYEKGADKKKLEDAFKGSGEGGSPSVHGSTLAQTTILARGAIGGQDFEMQYNPTLTGQAGNDDGEFYYSKTYFCTTDDVTTSAKEGGAVSFSEPESPYVRVDYVIAFKTKTGKAISENANINPAYSGYPRATMYDEDGGTFNLGGVDGGTSPSDVANKPAFDANEGPNGSIGGLPRSCVPPYTGSFELKNYYSLSSAQKESFKSIVSTAEASTNPSASGDADSDDANCEGGGALGWIICPVSELIANFATDMFQDVIAPMLENVPISTKRTGPDSGGFQAWQSMRAIANALLVISLLAVVYSQAKGGD